MSSATSEQIAGWLSELGDYVPPSFVEGIARAEHGKTLATNIPAGDFTAEPNDTTSIGLCQVNGEEAQSVGFTAADMSDPQKNAQAFYKLCAIRGPRLEGIGLARGSRDFFKYLAFYHNAGGGPALAFAQGNDWTDSRGGVSSETSFNSGKTLSYANFAADFAVNNSGGGSTDSSDGGDSSGSFGDSGSIVPGVVAVGIIGALIAGGALK